MADVISMAEKTQDNRHWSPLDCLDDAANDIRSGESKPTSVLLIKLNAADGAYDTCFYTANLKASEMLALLEVAKAKVLLMMGVIPGPS